MATDKRQETFAGTRSAADTRERILHAARGFFSMRGYENVGVREITKAAGVDASLVNRYFGDKQALFQACIQDAFRLEEHLPPSLDLLGQFLVDQVMSTAHLSTSGGPQDFNALRLLLLAAASPETCALVSARFQTEFVIPLATRLGGRNAALRAELIASYLIGLATMRHLLSTPALAAAKNADVAMLTGAAIQACVGRVRRRTPQEH